VGGFCPSHEKAATGRRETEHGRDTHYTHPGFFGGPQQDGVRLLLVEVAAEVVLEGRRIER